MFTRLWLVVPAGGEGMLHGAESPRSHCLHHRDRPHMCLAGLVRTAIQTEHSTFDTEFELMPLGRWLVHSYRQTHSISNLAVARKPEVLKCYDFLFSTAWTGFGLSSWMKSFAKWTWSSRAQVCWKCRRELMNWTEVIHPRPFGHVCVWEC